MICCAILVMSEKIRANVRNKHKLERHNDDTFQYYSQLKRVSGTRTHAPNKCEHRRNTMFRFAAVMFVIEKIDIQ